LRKIWVIIKHGKNYDIDFGRFNSGFIGI
jgi:hypothetical protein